MSKEGPNWDGLLKWSLAHSDGTRPNRNLSEEDRRWFMEAMQAQSVDVVKRMKEITQVMQTPEEVLEAQGVNPEDIEDMLDELQEHVESIDMANGNSIYNLNPIEYDLYSLYTFLSMGIFIAIDLHSIGGLLPLLGFLKNSHANIRAKAAEVVATIVQNNPRSQQMVMELNGLESLLLNFTSDPDVTARTKALGAISSLIRQNKPGIAAFRLANGYAGLRDALGSESVRFQRKALNLIHYLLRENTSDCHIVNELGFPRIMLHLASSDDAEVREAALCGLLELAKDKTGENGGGGLGEDDDDKLKQVLEERMKGISLLSPEDLGAAREERQLLDSLWNVCYKEPSSLREKGLVALPEEDAPPPDVASKHFEPPLRALSGRPAADSGPKTEEKSTPSLLSLGPAPSPDTRDITSSSATDSTS
ncbi:fes1 [Cucurbita argyrosperma subsp. argyrosperma]|nr:fes1 [Cucurbita argyrosperma subsp. argyrosperma]